ncbi:NHL domain-containing thioredoxin family protein [Cellulomonas sp. NPDC058312]|uniref:NHL domain-containing thioredoxin family protein n=1 Tax=Cellulomonas sp. NPDC058312 TaxID=3346441 RepID=UPI0036EF915D
MSTSTRLPKVRASELVGRGWLNTGGQDVALADLRGKIVLLDFWTFCCINCLHVLDELRELEEQYRDVLVIVGVHSPKFVHEADPVALAAAVERYEVHHPVLDDPELVTWSAYTARAWPTLVVIDPEGYIVAQMAGEGHQSNVARLVADLVAEHDAKGTLHRGAGPYVPPEPTAGTLRFPAKAVALPDGSLLVADAGHHSLAHLAADGETLVRRIGSGERGLVDGGPDDARFSEPNGLALLPPDVAEAVGYDLLVADTVNHALRGVRLVDGHVTTVAGTGAQYLVGEPTVPAPLPGRTDLWRAAGTRPATTVPLSSPWDVVWSPQTGTALVAMAGNHQLWAFDPRTGVIEPVAGTMNEGLTDGDPREAWFAQTSGTALAADGRVWLADSEVSALRWIDPGTPAAAAPAAPAAPVLVGAGAAIAAARTTPTGPADAWAGATVGTAVGAGLFDFGHRDGSADQALLQHPLGVAVLPDGSVVVADTYNGAVRRWAPEDSGPGRVSTLATGLAEPSGLLVQVDPDAGGVTLVVVESAAHRLTRVALPATLAGEVLDSGAHRTQRPVTDIAPGELALDVVFTPAAGQKYDDRYGDSTMLRVSATPPELLLDGAGDDVPLSRTLRINPAVAEGVLHVTARAASCDADPAIEFPACHLNSQDWGVPVRVADGAPAVLTLPLHG